MKDLIDQDDLLEEVIDFANTEIKPFAKDFESNKRIPRELIHKMAIKGYLAAPFPKEYGGMGLSALDYGLLTMYIGKACSSTRSLLTVNTSLVGETINKWGTTLQKKNILPSIASGEKIGAFALSEPFVGTDAKSIQTNYKPKKEGFILNGKKKWITLAGIADFFIVIAANEKELSAFIVDSYLDGITIKPIEGLMASRAAFISEIEFNNVNIDKSCILGKLGTGFAYIVNTALDFGRHSIAWGGLGIAHEAMESMVSYARERDQFGAKIYNFQLIQGLIADAITNVHAAKAICANMSNMRDKKHNDAIMETNMAKYFVSKVAGKITSDAIQVHGGNGCTNAYPAERLFREAKILEIIEGTSQIQQEIIARFGLRRYYNNHRKDKQ